MFTFTKMVGDRKAGDKVHLKFQRGEAVLEKDIALADRGAMVGNARSSNDRMQSMGSTISKRRTDFPSVMQTDLPLQATQCGGPVTDLDGNVVGLVIARSGRVDTMVLPSETIRQLLGEVDFSKEGQSPAQLVVKPKPEVAKPATQPAQKPEAPLLISRLAEGFNFYGDFDRAAELFMKVLERFPNLPEVRNKLVEIYLLGDSGSHARHRLGAGSRR